MPSKIKDDDLWPEEIAATTRSPLAILRQQAAALSRRTKGLVTAEVIISHTGDDSGTRYLFEIVVKTLRERLALFSVECKRHEVYPAKLVGVYDRLISWMENYRAEDPGIGGPDEYELYWVGYNEDNFVRTLKLLVSSSTVVTLLQGFVARVNDVYEDDVTSEETSTASLPDLV